MCAPWVKSLNLTVPLSVLSTFLTPGYTPACLWGYCRGWNVFQSNSEGVFNYIGPIIKLHLGNSVKCKRVVSLGKRGKVCSLSKGEEARSQMLTLRTNRQFAGITKIGLATKYSHKYIFPCENSRKELSYILVLKPLGSLLLCYCPCWTVIWQLLNRGWRGGLQTAIKGQQFCLDCINRNKCY